MRRMPSDKTIPGPALEESCSALLPYCVACSFNEPLCSDEVRFIRRENYD